MNEIKDKMLTVKLTTKEHMVLNDISEALGVSKSTFVRRLIKQELFNDR